MRAVDAEVLIAGGGLAAQRCCQTLRRNGFDGRIFVLCQESEPPYDRPPLSKSVLTGERPPQVAYRPVEWYADHGIRLLLGIEARDLDASSRTVTLQEHATRRGAGHIRYGELVVATGSLPRRLPGLSPGGIVHELRTREEALALRRAMTERRGRLAVIGAGLVGMEVASSARALGLEVTMVEAGGAPLARALPPTLGRWIAGLHAAHDVDVRLATSVQRLSRHGALARLSLSDGTTITADTVLAATGTLAATDWLASSGLGPGPIAVDSGGRTRVPGVYAAGDAACFPDPRSGEPIATPHWEAAAWQGAAVARSIAGAPAHPSPVPMFWSDQHGHRIQLVGHAPPECDIEIEGDAGGGKPFAAWMTRRGRPTAALLVDRPELVPTARTWIARADAGSWTERLSA